MKLKLLTQCETAIVKSHKENYDNEETMLVKKDSDNWFEDLFWLVTVSRISRFYHFEM